MQALFRAHDQAARRRVPVDAVLQDAAAARSAAHRERRISRERHEERLSRRHLAGETPAAAAAPATGIAATATPRPASSPRIVIVGGGLAGIRCAHALWTGDRALPSTIYEAATDHAGGRCWSLRGFFDNGLVAEHGGSFINHDESAIRDLARSLGLQELAVDGGDLPESGTEVFWIDGAVYSYAEANADWGAVGYRAFREAAYKAPWPQSAVRSTSEGRRLDRLNVIEWLDDCGIGAASRFGRLMQQNAMSEFGGDPEEQSALNLLSLLGGTNTRDSLDPLPGYDEKFQIAGGNDQIATRMLGALPAGTFRPGHRLVQVARRADGTYACTLDTAGGTVTTTADYLVLTLPFRMLREVDLAAAGFSPLKMTAIHDLGFGSIGKIHVQLSSKPWVPANLAGGAYSDPASFGVVWDDSVHLGRHGSPALMSIYSTGRTCDARMTRPVAAAHGVAPAGDVEWFFGEVENIYPGLREAYMGRAFEDNWAASPHHRGALAFWKVGQVTGFSRVEGVREGNALFAGEHTNHDGPGFMNSAITSGERVARTIRLEVRGAS